MYRYVNIYIFINTYIDITVFISVLYLYIIYTAFPPIRNHIIFAMCNKNQPPNNKKHRGFLEQTRSWICLVGEFFTFYHSQAPFCSTIWEEYVWFTFSKQRIEVANSILQVDNSLAPCCPKVPMRRGERQEHRIIHLMCVHIWYIEVQIWYIHMHVNMLHIWCIHILFRTWPAVYIYIYAYFDISIGFIRFSNRTSQMSTWCFLFLRFVLCSLGESNLQIFEPCSKTL